MRSAKFLCLAGAVAALAACGSGSPGDDLFTSAGRAENEPGGHSGGGSAGASGASVAGSLSLGGASAAGSEPGSAGSEPGTGGTNGGAPTGAGGESGSRDAAGETGNPGGSAGNSGVAGAGSGGSNAAGESSGGSSGVAGSSSGGAEPGGGTGGSDPGAGGSAGRPDETDCREQRALVDRLLEAAQECSTTASRACAGFVEDVCGCPVPVNNPESNVAQRYVEAVKRLKSTCSVACTAVLCPMRRNATCSRSGVSSARCVTRGLSGPNF